MIFQKGEQAAKDNVIYNTRPLNTPSNTRVSHCRLQTHHTDYTLNSREKFDPRPGFEPQTSRSPVWCSTT